MTSPRSDQCAGCAGSVRPYLTEPGDGNATRAYYRCPVCGARWQAVWDGGSRLSTTPAAADLAPVTPDPLAPITPCRAALNRAILAAEVCAYDRRPVRRVKRQRRHLRPAVPTSSRQETAA